jgi:DNA-binding response OmpR family regulator
MAINKREETMRVLLVEPDDDLCLSLRQVILTAGCRIEITGSFAEAADVMQSRENFDFLVTNASLPDGSGLQLAEAAARLGRRCIVIRRARTRMLLTDGTEALFRGEEASAIEALEQFLSRAPAASSAGRASW